MIIKIHIKDKKIIAAICDKDLLGKVFEDGKKILDLSSDFYRGDEKDISYIKIALLKAYIINAVGEKNN